MVKTIVLITVFGFFAGNFAAGKRLIGAGTTVKKTIPEIGTFAATIRVKPNDSYVRMRLNVQTVKGLMLQEKILLKTNNGELKIKTGTWKPAKPKKKAKFQPKAPSVTAFIQTKLPTEISISGIVLFYDAEKIEIMFSQPEIERIKKVINYRK